MISPQRVYRLVVHNPMKSDKMSEIRQSDYPTGCKHFIPPSGTTVYTFKKIIIIVTMYSAVEHL